MKRIYLTIILILISSTALAENYLRLRGLQASPLLSDSSEKGKFKSGSSEVDLETPPSKYQSVMISYGSLGIGTSSITTIFTFSGNDYSLESNWLDGAFIFDGPGNTSITLGGGVSSAGKGLISNTSASVSTETLEGTSWFGVFGLEYELPLNLGFIGLEFTEVLFGYRQNNLKYKEFKNATTSVAGSLNIQTVQYQFGIGLVF